jgi:hypothetical protein
MIFNDWTLMRQQFREIDGNRHFRVIDSQHFLLFRSTDALLS